GTLEAAEHLRVQTVCRPLDEWRTFPRLPGSGEVVREDVEQDVAVEEALPRALEVLDRGKVALMDATTRIDQRPLGMWAGLAVDVVVLADEVVVAHDLLAGRGIAEARVEPHRRPAVGGQFRDGNTNACALVFAQRE